jgi:hypothetical protein
MFLRKLTIGFSVSEKSRKLHLFLQNDGNLTVIENENYSENTDIVLRLTEQDLEEDSNTRPSSIEESELVGMGVDNKRFPSFCKNKCSSLSTSHKSASDCDRLHLEKLLRFEFDSCPIVLQLPIFPFSKSRLRVSTFSSGKSGSITNEPSR